RSSSSSITNVSLAITALPPLTERIDHQHAFQLPTMREVFGPDLATALRTSRCDDRAVPVRKSMRRLDGQRVLHDRYGVVLDGKAHPGIDQPGGKIMRQRMLACCPCG